MLLYTCTVIIVFSQIIGSANGECNPPPNNCFPSGDAKRTNTCVMAAVNESGLDWFGLQEKCAESNGRLPWLGDDFNETSLVATTIKDENNTFDFIPLGLLVSVKGDNQTFWRYTGENNSYTCKPSLNTSACLSSQANKTHCDAVGCCWSNNSCRYPELQNPKYVNITSSNDTSTTTRRCVGLKNNGDSWIYRTYDCFNDSVPGVGLICEHTCGSNWTDLPSIPSSNDINITSTTTSASSFLPSIFSPNSVKSSESITPTTATSILPSTASPNSVNKSGESITPTTASSILPSTASPNSVNKSGESITPTTASSIIPSTASPNHFNKSGNRTEGDGGSVANGIFTCQVIIITIVASIIQIQNLM